MKRTSITLYLLAMALWVLMPVKAVAEIVSSQSTLQVAGFVVSEQGNPGLPGFIGTIPLSYRGTVAIEYVRDGNKVIIQRVDQSVIVFDAGRFNIPFKVEAALKLDVYENDATLVKSIVPTAPGSYIFSPKDRVIGGIAWPNFQVKSPTFRARIVLIARGTLAGGTHNWGFLPNRAYLPLHRYYKWSTGDRFYTTCWSELGGGGSGYGYEGFNCRLEATPVLDTVPLYRYVSSSGLHHYTTKWEELGAGRYGYSLEYVQGYAYRYQKQGTIPLYRYYDTNTGAHFFTPNWNELGGGRWGYSYEGVECYVWPA